MPTYASATLHPLADGGYGVTADHWRSDRRDVVGEVHEAGEVGWTAQTPTGHPIGLYPHRLAAANALLKHAGFELLP